MDFNTFLNNKSLQHFDIFRFPDDLVPIKKVSNRNYVSLPVSMLSNSVVDITKNHKIDIIGGHVAFMFLSKDDTNVYDVRVNNQPEYELFDMFIKKLNVNITEDEIRKIMKLED